MNLKNYLSGVTIFLLLLVCSVTPISSVSSFLFENFNLKPTVVYRSQPPLSPKSDILKTEFSTLKENKNIRKGRSEYNYLPPKNTLAWEVKSLALKKAEGEGYTKETQSKWIEKSVINKQSEFEDKSKVKVPTLKLQLLEIGFTVTCKWRMPLPPPLKYEYECSPKELQQIIHWLLARTGEPTFLTNPGNHSLIRGP
ncbi:unnamed protein product [Orchesella dallaii]|uniref:Lipoprotein n=1 Tax=Orchesella dallaii TaxID=48710 RepID=A0ABP1R8C4_9HEXA